MNLIYKITNITNNKINIGKTKEYYKDNYFGIEGRFNNHFTSANSKSKYNDCPKLYNAMRKYGRDNFKIELIDSTTEDNIDEKEIYYIKLYDSINDKIGYNIALGGGGRSVVDVSDEIRNKISLKQTNNGIMNIKPLYDKDNVHIGYYARRRENGKVFQKYFTNSKFSIPEKMDKAKEWISNIKNDKTDNSLKFNKTNELPTNINYIRNDKDRNIIIGYRVDILKNGKKTRKSFQSKIYSLDELLNKAINFKNVILSNND